MAKGTGKKLAIGTAIGALAGYVAGILTAPKSGKATRKDIKNAASKSAAEAAKRLKQAQGELDKAVTKAKAEASKMRGKAKEEMDKALAKANFAKGKAAEMLAAVKSGEAEDKDLQKMLDEVTDAYNDLKKYLKKR